MKIKVLFSLLIFSIILFLPLYSEAGTDVTITPAGGFTFIEISDAEDDFEQFVDGFFTENEEVIPSALAMVNTLGYPNGKSAIKQFPHFEFGVAVGAGILEMNRSDDFSEEKPTIPFGGINGAFHIGTGITERLDVTVKFFSLGWFYRVDESFDDESEDVSYKVTVRDTEVYSVGAKFRYNLLPSITLIPILFTFGGVSLNLGFDYMNGETKTILEMQDAEDVEIAGAGLISATATYTNEGKIEWSFFSVTPEILVYLDLLYFISLYTGPSVSFNYGSFDFKMDGDGTIKSDVTFVPVVTEGETLGTIDVAIDYSMKPYAMIPKWTVGLEFNLWVLKLQAEVTSILSSPNDSVMGQVGVRMQF